MTWTCPRCDRRYPDSGIGLPRPADTDEKIGCTQCLRLVPEARLYELYSTLADATEAHAAGDPNGCASLTADAKEQVKGLRTEFKNAE